MESTGRYDLSVILNQLRFAERELTLKEVRNSCRTKLNDATLRRKLNTLIEFGLVTKRNNTRHAETKYRSVSPPLPSSEPDKLVALIDTEILATEDNYLAAAIIDKLRYYAINKVTTFSKSAAEIKQIFQTESSISTIRSIFNILLDKKVIRNRRLVGRKYHYELNTEFLFNKNIPEVLYELSAELTDLFCRYKALLGVYTTIKTREIWETQFRLMLLEDANRYERLRNAIAFLAQHEADSKYSRVFRTPSVLKKKLSELPEISNRKANRYLWKLKHGEIQTAKEKQADGTLKKRQKIDTSLWQPKQIELLHWHNAMTWVNGYKKALQVNFNRSRAGVGYIDFEDYLSEATKIAAKVFASLNTDTMDEKSAKKYISTSIFYRLKGYMAMCRDTTAKIKGTRKGLSEGECSIPHIVSFESMQNIIAEDDSEDIAVVKTTNNERKRRLLKITLETADKILNPRDVGILRDYIGADGIRHTQQEISRKYNLSDSQINRILQRSENELVNVLAPP